jgi:hypothetical protein
MMDKQIFRDRLEQSTKRLIEFTGERSVLSLSANIRYIIVPNVRQPENHLNHKEVTKLSILNRYEAKELGLDQTVSLLWADGNVPLWIDMSVLEATVDKTIVEVVCSRRFRDDQDLNHKVSEYPPFSIALRLPPGVIELKEGQKFDVNWRKELTEKKQTKSISNFLKKLFTLKQ